MRNKRLKLAWILGTLFLIGTSFHIAFSDERPNGWDDPALANVGWEVSGSGTNFVEYGTDSTTVTGEFQHSRELRTLSSITNQQSTMGGCPKNPVGN